MRIDINSRTWREQAQREDEVARVVWAHIAEAGTSHVPEAIETLGHTDALRHVLGMPHKYEAVVRRWQELDLEAEIAAGRKFGVRYIGPGDAEWPTALDDLEQPPHCLFALGEGDVAQLARRSVSVVGARAATTYGQRVAATMGCDLSTAGFTVVSGGAFGIDSAAHRGALVDRSGTICVLACGVDRAYPQAHADLFRAIRESGVLVSENPVGAAPLRHRFLHRNRLIAALSPATVVVEAGLRSGSLSTARRAAELSRMVAAVPGPVTSASSAGCHELIRDGGAVLVTDAGDVLELVESYGSGIGRRSSKESRTLPQDQLSARASVVWDVLPLHDPKEAERVAADACVSMSDVLAALGELQLAGLAVREQGLWRKTPLSRTPEPSATLAGTPEDHP